MLSLEGEATGLYALSLDASCESVALLDDLLPLTEVSIDCAGESCQTSHYIHLFIHILS